MFSETKKENSIKNPKKDLITPLKTSKLERFHRFSSGSLLPDVAFLYFFLLCS